VVVTFGDASLILTDPRTGDPLSHWSLPAVWRLNPSTVPALYAPDEGPGAETLELDDPTMIGAIETVRGAIDHARARPGRLRTGLVATAASVALVLAILWLPRALIAQTAAMVPAPKRAEIGRMALADVTRVTGIPCAAPLGLRAAGNMSNRVLGPGGGQILIVRDGLRSAAVLPGNIILLSRHLIEDQDGPEAAAGFALAAKLGGQASDPLVPLLRHAGLLATLRLLTSGKLPPAALAGYAEAALPAQPAPPADEALLAAFEQAGLASTPYAYARDASGESVLGLIEADPFRGKTPPALMPDNDWVSLQSICQEDQGG
jgi:hypothetical protein